jgi:hypothetical protein
LSPGDPPSDAVPETWNIEKSDPLVTIGYVKHDCKEHRLNADAIFIVMAWARGQGLTFEDFLKWVSHGRELTPEREERYLDEWDRLDTSKSPSNKKMIMILSLLYPHCDIENQVLRKFKWYYNVPIDKHLESLAELDISNKRARNDLEATKFVYLACPMGAGKTQTMLERMQVLEKDEKSLFTTNRQTLALDVAAKSGERGLVITNYLDHNYRSHNNWSRFLESQHQIISQESLWKLCKTSGCIETYRIVIIDEFESYLNQWKSDTHNHDSQLEKNWRVFIQLICGARTIYVLDAFPSQKGIEFIKDLGYTCKVISTPHTAVSRTARMMHAKPKEVYETIQKVCAYHLIQDRKLLVYYPYVEIHPKRKTIREIACGAFNTAAALAPPAPIENKAREPGQGLRGRNPPLVMERKMNDATRAKVMADVNRHWKNYAMVISNSTITVGVSFTTKWFDRVILCKNAATNPRDLLQFTFRARNLCSNVIEVFNLGGHKSHRQATDLATNSRLYKSDAVFKRLVDNIEYEQQATCSDCLHHLCVKAGYQIEECVPETMYLDGEVPFSEMIKVVEGSDAGIRWENINIPEVTCFEHMKGLWDCDKDYAPFTVDDFKDEDERKAFLLMMRRIRRREATTEDKLANDKLRFRKLFKEGVADDAPRGYWNGGRVGLVRKIHGYMKATCERSPRWRYPELCKKIENYMFEIVNDIRDAEIPEITKEDVQSIHRENPDLKCLADSTSSCSKMQLSAISKYFFGQSILKNSRSKPRSPWQPNKEAIEDIMRLFTVIEAPATMKEVEEHVFPYMDRPTPRSPKFPFIL